MRPVWHYFYYPPPPAGCNKWSADDGVCAHSGSDVGDGV